ncbi:GSCFA family protein [Pseudorhodobacter sp. E13]|uniref:GSCFA domain-containing protein n=1 Tax=Pseudorhodobacter sp. E13 TaxID=2487931 RepID=UPI000F8D255F|nr:GSCFA domain-containing protein [Pseudorhodobacter sp. E13]RUS64839.1 GSCFA family protein [Pseudorhodobacter sp. E13]
MTSPYIDLPARAYWRSGVAERGDISGSDLYIPKFQITRKHRIATAGSCFAQHVGRTLRRARFNVLDEETGPSVPPAVLNAYGYGLYSARYGNIYSARQLLQLLQEAFKGLKPAHPVWEKDGRFYDAFRPSVEPDGLPTEDDVLRHRAQHLQAVRTLFSSIDVFVFTFGLTETWAAKSDGTVYPTAPGTIAGTFDPDIFEFRNMRYNEILSDFRVVRKMIQTLNPDVRFVVTVSPVPLTATASGQHVEVASSYSKSVLRAVCGALMEDHKDVDYFPSYEVIMSQTAHGTNFNSNYRTVRAEGVDKAMNLFMQAHKAGMAAGTLHTAAQTMSEAEKDMTETDDLVCEEALLEAFAK